MAENDVNLHSQNLDIIPNRSPAAKCQHVRLHYTLNTQNIYVVTVEAKGEKKEKTHAEMLTMGGPLRHERPLSTERP
jgi:hypothetical protein